MLGEANFVKEQNAAAVQRVLIRTAGRRDEKAAISTIVMGFSTDPVARWMYPDADSYFGFFPTFVKAFAGSAFRSGGAFITDDLGGAALWLRPGVHPSDGEVEAVINGSVTEQVAEDFAGIFDQMDAYHPTEPHWYLPMIAVDTFRQGNGVGSALMQHALERCDEEGVPAYLESSNHKNIPLYERFGFERIGTIRSGSSPELYPMLRERLG